jgi:hypothetical protein
VNADYRGVLISLHFLQGEYACCACVLSTWQAKTVFVPNVGGSVHLTEDILNAIMEVPRWWTVN